MNKPITFKNEIIGNHAPENDLNSLKKLESTLKNNDLYRFYLSLTSSRAGVSRSKSTLLQKDILNLPYQEDLAVSQVEELIINDIVKFHLTNIDSNNLCLENDINEYVNIFCKTLNSIYLQEKSFQLFKVIDAGKYYALHFEYSSETLIPEQKKISDLEQYIEEAIPMRNDNQQKIHIQRIIKAYGQDSIILAKPKQLRYWLPSIALRDADETFADYVKSRYYNA